MSVREGLNFETEIRSDCAPLNALVAALLHACPEIHFLRDPPRGGGVTSVLNEIAQKTQIGIRINEAAIPINEVMKGACEMLGVDPLYVANEGRDVAFVPAEQAEKVLAAMRNHELGREAAIIGEVVAEHPGIVTMKTRVGGTRMVDMFMLSGEQLPRIC